jgi:hypothetical protein
MMQTHDIKTQESAPKTAAHQSAKGGISLGPLTFMSVIQPSLTVNQPDDPYEQEADKVAGQVLQMKSAEIQAKPLPISFIQRKCAHCEEEEKQMQRKELNPQNATVGDTLESYVSSLSSGGQGLPEEVRNS